MKSKRKIRQNMEKILKRDRLIWEDYNDNKMSVAEIAKKYGYNSRKTVYRRMDRYEKDHAEEIQKQKERLNVDVQVEEERYEVIEDAVPSQIY